MITEILDKDALLTLIGSWRTTIADARERLKNGEPKAVEVAKEQGWTDEDLAAFDQLLAEAQEGAKIPDEHDILREQTGTSGTDGSVDGKPAYIPGNEALSLVQTILEMGYLESGMVDQTALQGAVGSTPPSAKLSISQNFKPADIQTLFYTPFDEPNPRFITTGIKAVAYRKLHGRVPFNRSPKTYPLAKRARLVLVGDWGSGIERADLIADLMRKALKQGASEGRECHAVHLGDIYFCGWKEECQERFLDHWPVREGENFAHSWCLNGNHDMYCGGEGYFGVVLGDARFAGQGGCSYFSMENDDWQIFGLDTAYEEWSLSNGQLGWVAGERARAPKKKSILMTHHQPFSDYESGNKSKGLANQAAQLLKQDGATAWLWGHEHRCVVYKPRDLTFEDGSKGHLKLGACLGNGGVPTRPTKALANAGTSIEYVVTDTFEFDRGILTPKEVFGAFGFAILDIDGPTATLTTVTESGAKKTFSVA